MRRCPGRRSCSFDDYCRYFGSRCSPAPGSRSWLCLGPCQASLIIIALAASSLSSAWTVSPSLDDWCRWLFRRPRWRKRSVIRLHRCCSPLACFSWRLLEAWRPRRRDFVASGVADNRPTLNCILWTVCRKWSMLKRFCFSHLKNLTPSLTSNIGTQL